ncbi:MAG TPA: DUF5916 domain-containing protein [Candidatus Dormibacteraeota bacterium]|nr:DUF5916 domain-containing protein [Candidatus Dormibacteraeota bacterium]
MKNDIFDFFRILWRGALLLILFSLFPSASAWPAAQTSASPPQQGPPVAEAVRVSRKPALDGTLNDPLWQRAKPIAGFRQREPNTGEPATKKTEIRILYTRTAVYFGIHCYDSQPSRIVASELRRDADQSLDDHFEILIDETHDRRDGYVFEINPLGTQNDGLIVNEQGPGGPYGRELEFDSGWDGVWTSQARIGADGWTATVGIPFSTLNFTKSTDVVWGLNFVRFIRSKNEETLWSAYQRTFGITKVSQAGELRGITDIGSGRLFVVKPYALASYDRLSGQPLKTPFTGGVDIKYGLRSDMVLNLTANTDFADADVDLQQFNLTPFKIFIPEKRQFFLENAGIFNFDIGDKDQLFFTRQIGIDSVTGQQVPINGGAKLTGSLGGFQLGVLEVETRPSGSNPYGNYAVVRVKRSLFGDSYIGVMGIDKRSGSTLDPYNQTGGIDTRLVFFKNLFVDAHLAGTRSPGNPSGSSDVGASLSYKSNWLDGTFERRKIGPNFNPEAGFIERTDSNETLGVLTMKVRPGAGNIREMQFEGQILHAPDTLNRVSTQEWFGTFRIMLNNGAYADNDIMDVTTQRLATPLRIYKDVIVPAGVYHFSRHQVSLNSPPDHRVTFNLYDQFGGYYGGTLNVSRVSATYRPNPQLSFAVSQTWNRFRLPVANFSVDLASLQTSYSFSRFLTLSSVIQMNTANNQALSANFRLRYNYRPDSDLYIIYNVGTQFASLAATNLQQTRENRFAVKYTYSFNKW